MPLIDLSQLHVGDVLLEPGIEKIAANTGRAENRFGHASLALGRLVRIHAPGPGKIAVVEPFELRTWIRADSKLEGFQVKGDAIVLRPRTSIREIDIWAGAQWQAGSPYASADKLAELIDLTPHARSFLRSERGQEFLERIARRGVPLSQEGRSCGELVASILSLGEENVSPNTLVGHPNFETVRNAVVPEEGWEDDGPHPGAPELNELLGRYHQDTSRRVWLQTVEAAAKGLSSADEEALLETYRDELGEQLEDNYDILGEVESLAGEIFGF